MIIDPGPAVQGGKEVETQLKKTEGAADHLHKALLEAFGAIGLTVGLAESVKLLAEFSTEMAKVAIATGATGVELDQLSKAAQAVGLTTSQSASEAAAALATLGKAGFTTAQSMELLKANVELAEAADIHLSEATQVSTGVLKSFKLGAEDGARVVDVLAKASQVSGESVGEMGDSLKQVAPIAAGLNVSLEQTTAALSVLSQAMIKGQQGGSGLRKILSELEKPTDATNKILQRYGLTADKVKISQVGLVGALTNLKAAGIDTAGALELFGDRAGPAFNVLVASLPKVEEFDDKFKHAAGTAHEAGDIMDKSLGESLKRVGTAFQGLILAVGNSGAFTALTVTANALSGSIAFLATNIDALVPALTVLGVGLLITQTALVANVVAAYAAAAAYLTQLAATVALTFALGGFSAVAAAAARSLLLLSFNPFVLVIAGAAAAYLIIQKLTTGIEEYTAALKISEGGTLGGLTGFAQSGEQIIQINKQLKEYDKQLAAGKLSQLQYNQVTADLHKRLIEYKDAQDKAKNSTKEHAAAIAAAAKAQTDFDIALASSIKGLNDEARLLGLNNQEREIQTALLKEIGGIEKEGGPKLSQGQKDELEALIRRNGVLKDQSEALDSVKGPQEDFIRRLEALQQIMDQGKISTEEFNKAVLDLSKSASDKVDLTKLKLPQDLSNKIDLRSQLDQIKAMIEAEKERQALESQRQKIVSDLTTPLEALIKYEDELRDAYETGYIAEDKFNMGMAETEEKINLLNPQYALQKQLLTEITGPAEEVRKKQEALGALYAMHTITLEQYNKEMDKLKDPTPILTFSDGATDAFSKLQAKVKTTGQVVSDILTTSFDSASKALADFATTGKLNFADFARSLLADIAKIIAQQLLLQALGINLPGLGSVGGVTGHASGGEFEANKTMLVGEKGPELVSFGQPGSITPANQTQQALAQTGNGGGQAAPQVHVAPAQVKLQVVNVQSPDAARDAMDSAEGGKVIINQIRSNRAAIKRELS